MQMQNKMYFGVLRSPSEPGWQHFLVLRSNLHFDLSKIQVGTNWLSRQHPHIGFNFKNVMMLSPSLSLLSYFFFWISCGVYSLLWFTLLFKGFIMIQQPFKFFIFVRQPERYVDNRITISRNSKEIGLTQKLIVPFVGSTHFSKEESRGKKSKQKQSKRGKTGKMKIHLVLRFLPSFLLFFQFIFQGGNSVENKQKIFVRVLHSNLGLCFAGS